MINFHTITKQKTKKFTYENDRFHLTLIQFSLRHLSPLFVSQIRLW